MKTVLLKDQTVGQVEEAEIGQVVTVTLSDENGEPIEVIGEVEEILED
jgi:hypothetical protein